MSMYRENCERCHQPTNGVTIMSMYNEDIICMSCKNAEKKRSDYQQAQDADIAEIKKGNYNYEGIGLNEKKPTAVEWLMNELSSRGLLVTNDIENLVAYEIAKEKEYEQRIEDYCEGFKRSSEGYNGEYGANLDDLVNELKVEKKIKK